MAIKAIEAIEGCWAAAADDEPLFVLKSTDDLAPAIVREWARQYQQKHMRAGYGGPIWDSEKSRLKYESAWRLARQMEDYRSKLPAGGTKCP
jgi:hypothetical protein